MEIELPDMELFQAAASGSPLRTLHNSISNEPGQDFSEMEGRIEFRQRF